MTYRFCAQPDIEAYQIAQLLERLDLSKGRGDLGIKATDEVYEKEMPKELKRHFVKIEE